MFHGVTVLRAKPINTIACLLSICNRLIENVHSCIHLSMYIKKCLALSIHYDIILADITQQFPSK